MTLLGCSAVICNSRRIVDVGDMQSPINPGASRQRDTRQPQPPDNLASTENRLTMID